VFMSEALISMLRLPSKLSGATILNRAGWFSTAVYRPGPWAIGRFDLMASTLNGASVGLFIQISIRISGSEK
jgi:hypothetical protein